MQKPIRQNRHRIPPLEIRRNVRRTLVEQITDGIRSAITTGYYHPGDVLPPMRVFSEVFGVSRIVTNAVLSNLTAEGLIRPRQGVGAEVVGQDVRLWNGNVLLVLRDESGVFYMNVLASCIRDEMLRNNYLVSQVTVPRGDGGRRDFSLLDANLRQHFDLAVLIFDDLAIERRLSAAKIPFVVVGDADREVKGCVGRVRYRRDAACSELVRDCQAGGVRKILQVVVPEFPHDDLGVAFRQTDIEIETMSVSPMKGCAHPMNFLQGAATAFRCKMEKGRSWLPDLLYFDDDHLATGAFSVLPSYGIRIPDDVRVVSWANAGYGPVFRCSVARMEMDPEVDGGVVVKRALEYLAGKTVLREPFLSPCYRRGETFPVWTL